MPFQLQDKTAITGANLAVGDIFLTVDNPTGTAVVKKITAAELLNFIETQAIATSETLLATKDIGGSENLVAGTNTAFGGSAEAAYLQKATAAGVGVTIVAGDLSPSPFSGSANTGAIQYTGNGMNYDQVKVIPDEVNLQVDDGTNQRRLYLSNTTDGIRVTNARVQLAEGTTIASANDITCPDDGNFFEVSGSTEIQRIAQANWQSGARITLKLLGTPQITDATAAGGGFGGIHTATDANISTGIGDVFDLVFDGTDWFMPRSS
jgi:hypothetical protein